jgi:hypothetical protein
VEPIGLGSALVFGFLAFAGSLERVPDDRLRPLIVPAVIVALRGSTPIG